MHDGRVFNWRAAIIVAILLGFIAWAFRDIFTVYEIFQEKIWVNDRLTLYITRVEASSLSKDTFHFYLFDTNKSTEEFMSHVKDIKPLMITNDARVDATVTDGGIYLRVRGNVYAFSTVGFDINVHLDRSSY